MCSRTPWPRNWPGRSMNSEGSYSDCATKSRTGFADINKRLDEIERDRAV